jgi:hypothetical protein
MNTNKTLSKSKLIAYRQCPRRLWLELNRPELREDSPETEAAFRTGHTVGEIARRLYDPKGKGALIDPQSEGFTQALARSQQLLSSSKPIFEAGFAADGALAFADVMLPTRRGTWRMIEVKSSTKVKDYHREDAAIQAFVARRAGVQLDSLKLACIDSSWIYAGNGEYQGLLYETDLTDEAVGREGEVQDWITDAQRVSRSRREPAARTGGQCHNPFDCGFYGHCSGVEPQPKYPSAWLPRIARADLKQQIADGANDMRKLPDALLNERQVRVKRHTLSGQTYFDPTGAAAALEGYKLPAYFLDFETVNFAVPIWKSTRPYQQIPFQFSLHRLSRAGVLTQSYFLDTSGKDPSQEIARALIAGAGSVGPVFVYNIGFERNCLRELAERYPRLAGELRAIEGRLVDLLPITGEFYYHPSQQGSWSLKAVLPAIAPDLAYDVLGVQDGGMAVDAYREAIAPETSRERKNELEQQLIDYCGLDTLALVRIWAHLAGRTDLRIARDGEAV